MRAWSRSRMLTAMSTSNLEELRQRLADYRRLRTMTWDAQALGAIDGIIAETEERLRQLKATRAIPTGAVPAHR